MGKVGKKCPVCGSSRFIVVSVKDVVVRCVCSKCKFVSVFKKKEKS